VTPSFGSPEERCSREHAIQCVDRCCVSNQNSRGFGSTAHRRAMQGRYAVVVADVRIESARQHGFEHGSVTALGRHLHHEVMFFAQLAAQLRIASEHRLGACAISAGAGGDEAIERRKLVLCSLPAEPGSDCFVAVQFGQGERSATVGAPLMEGLVAFADGRRADAIALLGPLRGAGGARLGGSHAQRDVLRLTLQRASLARGLRWGGAPRASS